MYKRARAMKQELHFARLSHFIIVVISHTHTHTQTPNRLAIVSLSLCTVAHYPRIAHRKIGNLNLSALLCCATHLPSYINKCRFEGPAGCHCRLQSTRVTSK